ncbi:hypothetical protein L1987_21599 [Smallanthus sonchifolius]|uniref:Uncharacterized protein n=1 Tax=Smallanthus sonchifolius TaxID=185202 RepID=A0ACB9ID56_9ASTR|nr:hypothetical protein L1987_21599 [Smallanthus sonchifolius]
MIPSIHSPISRDKPPDPPNPSPFEPSGGRRSSSRLAVNARSHKGKESQGAGKSSQGLVKLNLGDFVSDEVREWGSAELGLNVDSPAEPKNTEQRDVGLMYLNNGLVLNTSQPMEMVQVTIASTSIPGKISNLNYHNVCELNTNDNLPLSPSNTTEVPDISMLPVDLNPVINEENCINPSPHSVGGGTGVTLVIYQIRGNPIRFRGIMSGTGSSPDDSRLQNK